MAVKKNEASKAKAPSIRALREPLKAKKFLPVYYLFGTDKYGIDTVEDLIRKEIGEKIYSELDVTDVYGADINLAGIISAVQSPPFGGGMKLVVVKEYHKMKLPDFRKSKGQKNEFSANEFFLPLTNYINKAPADTVLVLIGGEDAPAATLEYISILFEKGMIYEAKEQSNEELAEWMVVYAKAKGKTLALSDAMMCIEITGSNRLVLEAQMLKAFQFVGESSHVPGEVIAEQSAPMREYTVFQLLNAIERKNKKTAFMVLQRLLRQGESEFQILAMLTKVFYTMLLSHDSQKAGESEMIRIVGWFYAKYAKASHYYPPGRLKLIAAGLAEADAQLKLGKDPLTVLSVLLAIIFAE